MSGGPTPAGRSLRLVIETATRRSLVALGDGRRVVAESRREARERQGSHLLEQVVEVLATADSRLDDLVAVGVGTGPGSFTGLRVGLATAKTLAFVRALPIVGIPSGDALRRAAAAAGGGEDVVVVLPAGAHDRYVVGPEGPPLLEPPGRPPADALIGPAESVGRSGVLVATVDIDDAALGTAAAALGRAAVDGLAVALLEILDEALALGRIDEVERLVPGYVALPRGIAAEGEVAWSPDLW